jgi:phage gp36-like protein
LIGLSPRASLIPKATMAYSSEADILKDISEIELAQLTSESDATVDHDVVSKAIADADAEIDGYVAVRSAVPLDPVPALVNKLSTRIALYNLFTRRASRAGGVNETVKDNYTRAVEVLKAISKGDVKLGVDQPVNTVSSGGSQVESASRVFTRDSLQGF